MGIEISTKVQVNIDLPGIRNVPLEFYATGANYEEIRNGTKEFVNDYIAYHQLRNIKNVEIVYCDKEGLIRETLENFFNKI